MIWNLLKSELLPKYIKYKFSEKYKFLNQFNIKKNYLVVDVGAHVGEISEYFIEKVPPNPQQVSEFLIGTSVTLVIFFNNSIGSCLIPSSLIK